MTADPGPKEARAGGGRALRRTLLTLNVFAALKMTLFPMAVITLFWKDEIGLSLTEILTLQVFFSLASVVMEYPSGYVSDRLGYRWALITACVFGLLGWGWYLAAETFWGVLQAELMLGVCYAFISGSDTALLFETLRAAGRVDLYARCDGLRVEKRPARCSQVSCTPTGPCCLSWRRSRSGPWRSGCA
jgi:MFS family permease